MAALLVGFLLAYSPNTTATYLHSETSLQFLSAFAGQLAWLFFGLSLVALQFLGFAHARTLCCYCYWTGSCCHGIYLHLYAGFDHLPLAWSFWIFRICYGPYTLEPILFICLRRHIWLGLHFGLFPLLTTFASCWIDWSALWLSGQSSYLGFLGPPSFLAVLYTQRVSVVLLLSVCLALVIFRCL